MLIQAGVGEFSFHVSVYISDSLARGSICVVVSVECDDHNLVFEVKEI